MLAALFVSAGCHRGASSSCTLEARPGEVALDAGVIIRGTSAVVDVDKSDFAMTETQTHRVAIGDFTASFGESTYKGQTNQSVTDVEITDRSCATGVHVKAPPGCAYALREVRRGEYDLFCSGYAGTDYPVARLVRRP